MHKISDMLDNWGLGTPEQRIEWIFFSLLFLVPVTIYLLALAVEWSSTYRLNGNLKRGMSECLRDRNRKGFTLVEMIVAVALVLLIMLLLARVFGLASTTAVKQKGTAENDQKARTFTTVIQGDICARTFRKVMPFRPIKSTQDINAMFPDADGDGLTLRRGYFEISENDPESQKDDCLCFTIDYRTAAENEYCVFDDASGVLGRATILGLDNPQYLFQNPNQPEGDDGFPSQNSSGQSRMAEVCYYMRGSNLHRTVKLIRDQYDDSMSANGQPTDSTGADLVTGDYPGTYSPKGSPSFWRDFDYSAIYDDGPLFLVGFSNNPLVQSCLDNSQTTGYFYDFGSGSGSTPVPLAVGIPHFRYGHDITDGNLGRALEFRNAYVFDINNPTASTGEQQFIGRFTTQEVSHDTFTYPGNLNNGNPFDPTTINATDNDGNDIVDQYESTFRRGDDILLTNVIEFDVQVWDDIRGKFVNLGYGGANVGQYHRNNCTNSQIGNKLDTWHWFNELQQPPYLPAGYGVDLKPGVANFDDDDNDVWDDVSEVGWPGSDDDQPLKALRITIRFTDPSSGLVRTVTLDNSLVD